MEKAIKTLLSTGNEALIAFTKRNLLGETVTLEELWTLPRVKRILKPTNQRFLDISKQESNITFAHKLQPIPNIQDLSRISGVLRIKQKTRCNKESN